MFVVGNVVAGVAHVLDWVLSLYMWIVIARALISWVNPDPWNPIVQFLHRATEPLMAPIRRKMGGAMGLDISPIVVILVILFMQYAVVQSLFQLSTRLQ